MYSFVTAWARLSMLEHMRTLGRLGCKVFYTDTDSIIFLVPNKMVGEKVRLLFRTDSPAYGDWKSETTSPIISFVALGPKNYSYTTADGETVVKCRGFTLNNMAALKNISPRSMRQMLLDHLAGEKKTLPVKSFNIRVNRRQQKVFSRIYDKLYCNDIFDKRVLLPSESDEYVETIPFGAKHIRYADLK